MGYIKDSSALPSSMTSNTGENGKASVSTFADNYVHLAFRAFDKNTGTYWQAQSKSGWAKYEFDLPIVISKYSLRATGTINGAPKQWTFEGSNDDQSWNILDSRTNITNWTSGLIQEYVFSNAKKYKFYRINIATTKDDTERIQLSEIDMFELVYYDKFLISSEDRKYSYAPKVISTTNIIPTMTSNTAPSGVASASSITSTTYDAWKAFDKVDNSQGWVSAANSTSGWISFEFVEAVAVGRYYVKGNNNATADVINANPKDWNFEGLDGSNWIILDRQNNQINWTQNQLRYYSFDNYRKFKKYRLNILSNNGFSSVGINELGMMTSDQSAKLIHLNSPSSENQFLSYGLNSSIIIDLNEKFTERVLIKGSDTLLGSGKVFKQKIDTSKIPIKKASIT